MEGTEAGMPEQEESASASQAESETPEEAVLEAPRDESLRTYFESLEWYQGTVLPEDFDESVFNEYEFANRDLIVEYEKEQGYR